MVEMFPRDCGKNDAFISRLKFKDECQDIKLLFVCDKVQGARQRQTALQCE